MASGGQRTVGDNDSVFRLEQGEGRAIVRDENNIDVLLIGKDKNGEITVDLALPGIDVKDAALNQLVFSSKFNLFKIIREGIIEPIPRSGTVTLSGNNIGYSFDIDILIGADPDDPLYEAFIGKVLTNVCFDSSKRTISGGGLFYDDGTNQAFYEYSYELQFNTKKLNIQFNVRLTKGSVSFIPTNLFYRRLYWQIANPTRDLTFGGGAGGLGDGKYFYKDKLIFNEDGTVNTARVESTVEFINGNYKIFPQRVNQ